MNLHYVTLDVEFVFKLPVTYAALPHERAVHNALVQNETIVSFGREFTSWRVAGDRAKRKIPVLNCMILEFRGRSEGLLTPFVDALEQTWRLALVFCNMHLKKVSIFDDLATQWTLVDFALRICRGLKVKERVTPHLRGKFIVAFHVLFEIFPSRDSLLAPADGAFNDSWVSSFMVFHVLPQVF